MTDAPSAAVAPGFFAFVAFFIMAMVLWFLMRNMNARMRRMSYRQQAAHRGRDEAQAGPGDDRSPADDSSSKDTGSSDSGGSDGGGGGGSD
jgi:uncharacterized membrane protein YgcG